MTDCAGNRGGRHLPSPKLYLALSRTPHGVLDLAMPLAAMLLQLGGFPPLWVVLVGLVSVFAGYTAVYAVNDIVDHDTDKAALRFKERQPTDGARYLDAVFVRHPLAQGLLTMRQAVYWAGFWAVVSLAGAWLLNPVCALLLFLGVLLETVYCKLLRVTHWRAAVNGVVKTLGPMAAVFAVEPAPQLGFLLLLFLWIFFWEIGGQNIPADWHDIEQDRALGARTVPVALGPSKASTLAVGCLVGSLLLSLPLFVTAPLQVPLPLALVGVAWGWCFTAGPARRLARSLDRADASALFNRSSFYPSAMLAVILLSVLFF